MNTGFLGPAVATVLTVYGIETYFWFWILYASFMLQQYLPFTVLKRSVAAGYGHYKGEKLQQYLPFTVLKPLDLPSIRWLLRVATVLTVYGIETRREASAAQKHHLLQQYLPFTVLKHKSATSNWDAFSLSCNSTYRLRYWNLLRTFRTTQLYDRCNSAYRLRYWNTYDNCCRTKGKP